MNRFESLQIKGRPVGVSLFHYSDHFYDTALRRYSFKEALHLYLKRNGYQTIVFYNLGKGIHSFEKPMLEYFLNANAMQHTEPPKQTVMPRIGRGTGRFDLHPKNKCNAQDEPGISVVQDNDGLWGDVRNMTRDAQVSLFCYNLQNRKDCIIVIEPSYGTPEFLPDQTIYLNQLIECIKNEKAGTNNNHIILLAETSIYAGYDIPDNINPSSRNGAHITSSFWNTPYFLNLFLRSDEKDEQGNAQYSLKDIEKSYGPTWVMPVPAIDDCKNAFQYWRIVNGKKWTVEWKQMDDIMSQISHVRGISHDEQPKTTDEWENIFSALDKISYKSFDEKYGIVDRSGNKARKDLEEMQGIDDIISKFYSYCNRLHKERKNPKSKFRPHMAFLGSPGTGKTTVARLFAQIMKDMGLLSVGHLVQASAGDFIAGYLGQTRSKAAAICEKARGGILFIDEAYGLYSRRNAGENTNSFGEEAVEIIIQYMENYKNDIVFIFAGYEDETRYMLENGNAGLAGRIDDSGYYTFAPYPPEVLCNIALHIIEKDGWKYNDTFKTALKNVLRIKYTLGQTKNGNVRFSEGIAGRVLDKVKEKNKEEYTITITDLPYEEQKLVDPELLKKRNDEIFGELGKMVGQEHIKERFWQLYNSCLAQRIMLINNPGYTPRTPGLGYILLGPSGTGKTTFARVLSNFIFELGLMPGKNGDYYLDITGPEIRNRGYNADELLRSCLSKILFIDEAYALPPRFVDDMFGAMQKPEYKDKVCVILAGHEEKMHGIVNYEGFDSCFPNKFIFMDYSDEELTEILFRCKDLEFADGCRDYAVEYFLRTRTGQFNNGHEVDILIKKIEEAQYRRFIEASAEEQRDPEFMRLIIPEDFPNYIPDSNSGIIN